MVGWKNRSISTNVRRLLAFSLFFSEISIGLIASIVADVVDVMFRDVKASVSPARFSADSRF